MEKSPYTMSNRLRATIHSRCAGFEAFCFSFHAGTYLHNSEVNSLISRIALRCGGQIDRKKFLKSLRKKGFVAQLANSAQLAILVREDAGAQIRDHELIHYFLGSLESSKEVTINNIYRQIRSFRLESIFLGTVQSMLFEPVEKVQEEIVVRFLNGDWGHHDDEGRWLSIGSTAITKCYLLRIYRRMFSSF